MMAIVPSDRQERGVMEPRTSVKKPPGKSVKPQFTPQASQESPLTFLSRRRVGKRSRHLFFCIQKTEEWGEDEREKQGGSHRGNRRFFSEGKKKRRKGLAPRCSVVHPAFFSPRGLSEAISGSQERSCETGLGFSVPARVPFEPVRRADRFPKS